MKSRLSMPLALVLLVLAGGARLASAQLADNLGALSGDNAKKYLGPLPDALSGTMNSAIFTSGEVPKAGFGFSIGIEVMGVAFRDEDRWYTPTDPAGFTSAPPIQRVPTVIGGASAVAQNGQGGLVLYYPGGFDLGEFLLAAPQLTVGSVLGTRAVVRWIDGAFAARDFVQRVHLFGIGAQHSLSQYLPATPLDLALGVFYQSFTINGSLLKTRAFHVDVTGSRDLGVVQPFAAIGMDTFTMAARYEDVTSPGDVIAVDFGRRSHIHLTAGVLASLGFATLHAEANIAARNGLAAGLRFGL